MLGNKQDIERIFETYDQNKNNNIDYDELRELLIDLEFEKQFTDEDQDTESAFEEFLAEIWTKYDRNGDGFISFEEFIDIHTDLIDK